MCNSSFQRITFKCHFLCDRISHQDRARYVCGISSRRFQFGQGVFVLLEAMQLFPAGLICPCAPCENRYAVDTSLYFFSFFRRLFIAPRLLHIFSAITPVCRFKRNFQIHLYYQSDPVLLCCGILSCIPCLELQPLKRCVRTYSHTRQVVVLLDSSPTGILPAPVVIVTDVQPQDIAFLCSQFLRVLCVM